MESNEQCLVQLVAGQVNSQNDTSTSIHDKEMMQNATGGAFSISDSLS